MDERERRFWADVMKLRTKEVREMATSSAGRRQRAEQVRDLQMLLDAANTREHTEAVAFRCPHWDGRHGTVMSLESAIEHWAAGCRPWGVATSMKGVRDVRAPVDYEQTFWAGRPAVCRRVWVIVGFAPRPEWWCSNMVGHRRPAVEVRPGDGEPFYIDDEDEYGWYKVTEGRGAPEVPHRIIPVLRVEAERDPPAGD